MTQGIENLVQRFGKQYPPEAFIFCEGDQNQEVYFILEGRVQVALNSGHVLCQLGPGDVFGEMALFNHAPRSASVKTLDTVQLLCFNESDLYQQITLYPELAVRLLRLMTQRMQRMDHELKTALSQQAYLESTHRA